MKHSTSYPNHSQEVHQFKNTYLSQDAQVPQCFHHSQTTDQLLAFDLSTSCNLYVNDSVQYIYQWENLPCYKCSTPGHILPKCNHDAQLYRAESTYLRNFSQRPASNRKFDFLIPSQIYNTQESTRN